jgi:hypothetical protein
MVKEDFPFDPSTNNGERLEGMSALRANFSTNLRRYPLPHNDTDFEPLIWLDNARKFRRANNMAVSRTNQLIIASLDEAFSETVPAIATEDEVEGLAWVIHKMNNGHVGKSLT